MPIRRHPDQLLWRVHLNAAPAVVFAFLATDSGREAFWAETSTSSGSEFILSFPDSTTTPVQIRLRQEPHLFEIDYFGAVTRFVLQPAGEHATDLEVSASGVPADDLLEVGAGWVSVLLALKSVINFGNDLRNHERARTWSDGYVDN